ncbi:MAG: hypothetical protein E6G88_12050 [Alphaproteobacteria bacterium]|nr:MAG: hypothetical protein E6G88_12050 [Alphaproteobacteria bacterium]
MIQILLIAAAMLLAPASVRANAVEIVRLHPAAPQPGRPVAHGVAQNAAASTTIAGTYAGKVDRRYINGEPQATRTYRLTMNPDMNTAKVLIYDLEGKLLNEIGLVGKMTDDRTLEGKTTVINSSPNYKPDNVRLVFSPDRSSVEWYHNDGTLEGSGTLSHRVE